MPNTEKLGLEPNEPADILHQKAVNITQDHEDEDSGDKLAEIAGHKNASPQTLAHIYNHVLNIDGTSPVLKTLFSHKNFPAQLAESYIENKHGIAKHSYLDAAAGVPGVDTKKLEALTYKTLHDPQVPHYDFHMFGNLSPEFYHNILRERDAAMDKAPDNESRRHIAAKFNLAKEKLATTNKHTPESLSRAVEIFAQERGYGLGEPVRRFVKSQEGLTKDQLDKMWQGQTAGKSDDYDSETLENILSHKNVDPALLAKVAQEKPARARYGGEYNHAAISNPRLPSEARQTIVRRLPNKPDSYYSSEDNAASAILENPEVTADEVRQLAQKGYSQALKHDKVPPEVVANAWNASTKNAEAARSILNAPNLPPEVLKELVNHKNQDVAIEALNHKNVNMDVLNTALKRKAAAVQEAARVHPMVADTEVRNGLMSGKMRASSMLADKSARKVFDQMNPGAQTEVVHALSDRYGGPLTEEKSRNLKEDADGYWATKQWLMNHDKLSPVEQKRHKDDIIKYFQEHNPSNQNPAEVPWHSGESMNDAARSHLLFKNMIRKNDPDAQKAMLDHPGMLQEYRFHEENDAPDMSPDFLRQVHQKAIQYAQQNRQVFDRRGNPEPFNANDVERKLVRNSNLPSDTFNQITNNPEFYKDSDSYVLHGNGIHDKEPGIRTIFDERLSDADEPTKRAEYSRLLNIRSPDALKAVASSYSAPKDQWKEAFNRMPGTQQLYWAEYNNFGLMADPETRKRGLNGEFNSIPASAARPEEGNSNFQRSAIASLKPGSAEDQQIAREFLLRNADLDQTDPQKADTNLILHHLNQNFIAGENGGQLVQDVARKDPNLGMGLAIHKAQLDTEEQDPSATHNHALVKSIFQNALQAANEGSEDDHGGHALANLLTSSDPTAYSDNINSSLRAIAGMSHRAAEPNGALDFLADLPGPDGKRIRHWALSNGYISKKKVDELVTSNTQSISDNLRSLPAVQRGDAIRSLLSTPERFNPEVAEAVSGMVNSHSLADYPDDYEKSSKNLQALTHLVHQHAPEQLSRMFGNIFHRSTERRKSGMTIANKKALVKGLISHVQSTYDMSTQNKILLGLYDGVGPQVFGDSALVGPKLLSTIAKNAVATNDADSLVALLDQPDAPKSVTTQVNKMLAKPENLTPQQVIGLSSVIRGTASDAAEAQSLINAFDSKMPSMSPDEQLKLPAEFARKIGTSLMAGDLHEDKNKVLFSTLKRYASSDNPALAATATAHLVSCIGQDNTVVPYNEQVHLFQTLPSDLLSGDRANIGTELANDPQIVEAATSGWKLWALADHMESLNKQNASILINRLVNSTDPKVVKERHAVLRLAVSNVLVDPNDITKFARTMDDKQSAQFIDKAVDDAGGNFDSNFLDQHMDKVLDTRMHRLDELLANPGSASTWIPGGDKINVQQIKLQPYSHEHVTEVLKNAISASKIFAGSAFADDAPRLQEKVESYGNAIKKMAEVSDKITSHYLQNPPEDPNHSERVSESLGRILDHVLRANMKLDKAGTESALKILSNSNHLLANIPQVENGIRAAQVTDRLQYIVEKAEGLKSEDWKNILSTHSDAQFMIQGRSVLTSDILDHVDLGAMENHSLPLSIMRVGQWFEKMDSDAIDKHGPALRTKLLEWHSQAQEMRGTAINKSDLYDALNAMADHAPGLMDYQTVRKIIDTESDAKEKSKFYATAVKNGVGGAKLVHDLLDTVEKHAESASEDSDVWEMDDAIIPIVTSKAIDEQVGKRILEIYRKNENVFKTPIEALAKNAYAPPSIMAALTAHVLRESKAQTRHIATVAENLLENPQVPESSFTDLFKLTSNGEYPQIFAPNTKFHPALANGKHGGRLFRSMPVKAPGMVPNIQEDSLVKAVEGDPTGDYAKRKQRLTDAMTKIPPAGIAWAEAKKVFPQFEQIPEVKKVFMDKKNKPVLPEDFAAALKANEDAKRQVQFHMTYSVWKSNLQRHNPEGPANLVLQLNNSEKSEAELNQDPKLWSLYQKLLREANGIHGNEIGLHPTTPQLVSWVRVDTSGGKDGWVIEEIQSDFAQKFRKNLRHLIEQSPSGLQIDGHSISAADVREYAKRIDKAIEGYVSASLEAAKRNAAAHGVSKLFMHGVGVRANMSGGDRHASYSKDYINERIRDTYERYPATVGFQKCDYTDYPNYSKSTLREVQKGFGNTDCWVMDLSKKP